jgi:hypothetical protein
VPGSDQDEPHYWSVVLENDRTTGAYIVSREVALKQHLDIWAVQDELLIVDSDILARTMILEVDGCWHWAGIS